MIKRTVTVGLMATAALVATPAWAHGPNEFLLQDCATGQSNLHDVCGPTGANTGPGYEQGVHAITKLPNGEVYVTVVYMTSKVSVADRPYQGACSSFKMDSLRGPILVADKVQLSANDGNRPFNHPALSAGHTPDGSPMLMMLYGTNDPNQTNVATYAQAIDHMCNILTPTRVKVSNDDNNNSAAPAVTFLSNGVFGGGYYVNGANQTHAIVLHAARTGATVSITETADQVVIEPTNIGRPSVATAGPDHFLIFAAQGAQRPPEDGIAGVLFQASTGQATWHQLVMAADNTANPVKRYNTPQLAPLANGRFLVQFEQTNARGRDGNNNRQRGQTRTHLLSLVVDTAANTVQTEAHMQDVGVNQVHGTICNGNFGTMSGGAGAAAGTGFEPHIAVYDASITGSGIAAAQMVKFDVTSRSMLPVGKQLAIGSQQGDGGYLSNIYGQNPNTQGREFLSCLGDVPNAGYHVTNGFRPDVKSFFVFSYGAMVPPGTKNSAFTSFYPAEVDTPVPPMLFPLQIAVSGNGQGRVTSSPTGINCSHAMCSTSYEQNVVVTLTSAPAAGSKFDGWSGDCTGTAQCVVRIDQARNVTASFSKIQGTTSPIALFVTYDGDGHGLIASNPAGISCNAPCNANFDPNASITLTATPDSGSKFMGWSGDCNGIADCTVTLDIQKQVTARFISVQSGGGIAIMDPRGPDPRTGTGIGTKETPAPTKHENAGGPTGVCSTTGNNTGALVPMLLAIGFIALIRRRRNGR